MLEKLNNALEKLNNMLEKLNNMLEKLNNMLEKLNNMLEILNNMQEKLNLHQNSVTNSNRQSICIRCAVNSKNSFLFIPNPFSRVTKCFYSN
jgi:uncharacterized phage infection (PIP) family protein YhgE